ncbi:MAG: hypothetical protein ACYTGG_07880 [Planctomycetota bacterium]|jgi:hypothetical protein
MSVVRPTDELRLALPTARLVLAAIGTGAVCAGGWWVTGAIAGWTGATIGSGLAGAAAVGVAMLVSLVAISPWKERTLTSWMTAWLASMGLRLLLTPLGAFLLYSAALLRPEPLAIAVALAYLSSLLVEAAVLARHVRHAESSRAEEPGR